MNTRNIPVKNKIVSRIQHLLPGTILFAQDFFTDGSSEAVRQQLTRLVKAGLLKRLSQGVYLIPKKLGEHGYLLPTAEEIAMAIARRDKSRIIPTGEVALWKLGLSTQVPLKYVYLTDGPSRIIKIEETEGKTSYTITFKHASPKNFALRGKISSQVIQALKAIGEKNLSEDVLDKIRSLIMRENLDDLNHDLTVAPVWISKLIKDSFNSYK
ncbi:MAG: type IV toxin-antitoxin system AbiEi family antitoxin domain-containing protein [Algoriphagus sp.]|jgi:hypothetical protein|nr:type IV toxin-antitoxin system AbiEi family antitoxin domain-containing protein [Algoriphagus sp.]